MAIPFIDLAAQKTRIGSSIETAIKKVLDHGAYIMGPEVRTFEANMAAFANAKHCLSCANGTDAIELILLGLGISKGDRPPRTFARAMRRLSFFKCLTIYTA